MPRRRRSRRARHYLRTFGANPYQEQFYSGLNCYLQCPTGGTPVTVTAAAVTTGIDFPLIKARTFWGYVTDAQTGAGLYDVTVTVYSTNGATAASTWSDSTGYYAVMVPVGTYYVAAGSTSQYLGRVYPEADCPSSCAAVLASGTPVNLAVTSGPFNFALKGSAAIRGRVTDAATGAPVAGMTVRVSGWENRTVWSGATGTDGGYLASGLVPHSYKVRTPFSQGYVGQVYRNANCPVADCDWGDWVDLGWGETKTGVDFALVRGGAVSGRVTRADTGAPMAGVTVDLLNQYGYANGSMTTDANGVYNSGFTIPPGAFYVGVKTPPAGYLVHYYNGVNCGAACVPNGSGTLISVAPEQVRTGIDLALARTGVITGTVTAGDDGRPLSGVDVTIYTSITGTQERLKTDSRGVYVSTSLIVPGTCTMSAFSVRPATLASTTTRSTAASGAAHRSRARRSRSGRRLSFQGSTSASRRAARSQVA